LIAKKFFKIEYKNLQIDNLKIMNKNKFNN